MAENGSMKVAKEKIGQVELIRPVTHEQLFFHCANGEGSVCPDVFEKLVRPMLIIHGIKEIKII